MEYNLDTRVVLSSEREHKNLYSWSIKEFDEKGTQVGRDHIPWNWGLRFEVIELHPSYSLQMKEGEASGEEGSGYELSEVSEYLYGKLIPSVESRKAGIYSMFGTTRRRIDQFGLFIYKAKEGESECCRLWGSASYTSEWDFQNVTEPDSVQVYVYLTSEIDQLMNLVKVPVATEVTIRLSGVSGFYSDWSPSIRTDSIKVLANAKDQQLENPENLAFDPQRTRERMRWTRRRRRVRCRRASSRERSTGARDERRFSVRQNRVVPTPVAGAKLSVAKSIPTGSISRQAGSDGDKTNSSPGRARYKPSSHCAGNAGLLRLYLYARVRFSLCILHTRPRVQRAPGIPCSVFSRGTTIAELRRVLVRAL